MKKNALFLPALAIAALGLSACGGGTAPGVSSTPSSAPSSTATPATTASSSATTSTPATETTSAAPTSASTEATAASSSAAAASSNAKPAAEGKVMKSGAAKSLPATVMGFTADAGSGPAVLYKDANHKLIGVGAPLSSPLASLVEYIKKDKTRAGTGWCGGTGATDSIVCYVDTKDGVINLSATSSEIPLETLVAFANELAAAVGVE